MARSKSRSHSDSSFKEEDQSKKVFLLVLNRKKHPEVADFLDQMGELAVHYYNDILFVIRQQFTSYHKECIFDWTENELAVWQNIQAQEKEEGKPFRFLHRESVQRYAIRNIHNEFNQPLYSHIKLILQQQAIANFRNWLTELNDWKVHPEKYKARPNMPGYKKSKRTSFGFTNQAATITENQLNLPGSRSLPLTWLPEDFGRLKQVDVMPYYDTWRIACIYDEKEAEKPEKKPENIACMDLGVDRLAAIAEKSGCLICNGKPIKSELQYYNKKMAFYQSLYDPYKEKWDEKTSMNPLPKLTRRMKRLLKKRNNLIHDHFHKMSTAIIDWLKQREVTILVIGKNDGWKQEVNMGKKNNQNFAYIPHAKLIKMLKYKAAKAGIQVILTEESYTSAASYIDRDPVPSWDGKHHPEYIFSGSRSSDRSQYISKEGIIIQADIHGACNIGRKVFPDLYFPIEALQKIEKLTICTRKPKVSAL